MLEGIVFLSGRGVSSEANRTSCERGEKKNGATREDKEPKRSREDRLHAFETSDGDSSGASVHGMNRHKTNKGTAKIVQ